MQQAEGRLPDSLIACIGGGSNAMGLFHPFLDDTQIEIYGVEAAGHGLRAGLHAASIAGGRPGVLHGNRTYLLMDDDGQINEAHSISAGLDYPGIGPEHAWLNDIKRVKYLSATDEEALAAFELCSRLEGIIPALEPAHALARVMDLAPQKPKDHLMVVNLSGRGDKDLASVADYLERRERRAPAASRACAGAAGGDQQAEDRRLDSDRDLRGLSSCISCGCGCSCRGRSSRRRNGCNFIGSIVIADARHHQCPHGRDAGAPPQGTVQVNSKRGRPSRS